jgi:hypothetical protein
MTKWSDFQTFASMKKVFMTGEGQVENYTYLVYFGITLWTSWRQELTLILFPVLTFMIKSPFLITPS